MAGLRSRPSLSPPARRPRRRPSGLAWLVALAGCGGMLVLASAAAGTGSGSYGGRTSQPVGRYGAQLLAGNGVSFSLAGGRVSNLSVPWVAQCDSDTGGGAPPIMDRTQILDPLPLKRGRFSAVAHYSFSPGPHQSAAVDPVVISGQIRGAVASGTVDVTAVVAKEGFPVAVCESHGPIRWSARVAGAAGGQTPPRAQRPEPPLPGYITYTRASRRKPGAIWISSRDGAFSTQLTHPPAGAADSTPSIPPGFDSVAFARTVAGVSQIYQAELWPTASSGPAHRETNFPQGAREPAVSEQGTVAFTVGTGGDCSIWVLDPASAQLGQLTDHGGRAGCDEHPSWSFDGSRLLFHRTLLSADGAPASEQNLIVSAAGGATKSAGIPGRAQASWGAPRLVFIVPAHGSVPASLHTATAGGRGDQTILRGHGLMGIPVWSPYANEIAFTQLQSDGTTDIAAVATRGGQVTRLTQTPGASDSDPAWNTPPLTAGGGPPGPGVRARSQPVQRRRR